VAVDQVDLVVTPEAAGRSAATAATARPVEPLATAPKVETAARAAT
jgi:hypothetical protein